MSSEEKKFILQKLKELESEADRANDAMNNFQSELTAAATDIAFKHFSPLHEMSGEQIKKFGNLLSDSTWQLTMNLDELRFEVKRNP